MGFMRWILFFHLPWSGKTLIFGSKESIVSGLVKVLIAVGSLGASYFALQYFIRNEVITLMIMGSTMLHEFGHLLAFRKFGYSASMFFVPLLGAAVKPDDNEALEKLSWYRMAIVILAGSAVNVVLLGLGLYFSSHPQLGVHALALASINASLAAFNLLPLGGILDGGKFAKTIFSSMDEKTDELIYRAITGFAVLVIGSMLLMGKFSFFSILLIWGIRRQSRSDNPSDHLSSRAMTSVEASQLLVVYMVMLIGSLVASTFLPSWSNFSS